MTSVNRLASSAIILTDQLEGLLKFVYVDGVKRSSDVEMDEVWVHSPKGKFVRA